MLARVVLMLMSLFDQYSCPDDCWGMGGLLDIDSVEFEDEAQLHLNFCLTRFHGHFSKREGDSFRRPIKCWQAEEWLRSATIAKIQAEDSQLTVPEIRSVAKDILGREDCTFTRGEQLTRAYEREHRKQQAQYDCSNAEDQINYGPLGMGPYRKKNVDLNCWYDGWRHFAVEEK